MDKSWISWDPNSSQYQKKVKDFIINSKKFARNPDRVICPCLICRNRSQQNDETILFHLTKYGFDPTYKVWVAHGDPNLLGRCVQVDDFATSADIYEDAEMLEVHQMYEDACFQLPVEGESPSLMNVDDRYQKKISDAEVPLYPGCTKYTKLSATLIMYSLKAESGLSNSGFDKFMSVFEDMLPQANTFPESLSTVKKTLKDFDLGYEKIDACVNDCILFRGKDYENLEKCPTCDASRYKINPRTGKIKEGVAAKVLRYFPIIPRLQRMFLSASVSEQLTWHSSHHSRDGKMRHPVDSVCWSSIDKNLVNNINCNNIS